MKIGTMSLDTIQEIHRFYCETFGKNPNRYKLSTDRKRKIKARLKEFSPDEIKQAMKNLSRSAYHLDNGYTGLDFLLRSYGQVEKWRDRTLAELQSQNRQYARQNPGVAARLRRKAQAKAEREEKINLEQAEKLFYQLSKEEQERLVRKAQSRLLKELAGRKEEKEVIRNTARVMAIQELVKQ